MLLEHGEGKVLCDKLGTSTKVLQDLASVGSQPFLNVLSALKFYSSESGYENLMKCAESQGTFRKLVDSGKTDEISLCLAIVKDKERMTLLEQLLNDESCFPSKRDAGGVGLANILLNIPLLMNSNKHESNTKTQIAVENFFRSAASALRTSCEHNNNNNNNNAKFYSLACRAFALNRYYDEAFFAAVGKSLMRGAEIDDQGIANVLHSFATVGYFNLELFEFLVAKFASGNGGRQETCNVLWSCAIAGILEGENNFLEVLLTRLNSFDEELFTKEELIQLFQVFSSERWNASATMVDKMKSAAKFLDVDVSRSQMKVSKVLTKMGVEHKMEQSPWGEDAEGDRFHLVDFVITGNNQSKQKIAMEYNGMSHYVRWLSEHRGGRDVTLVENGPTQFKTRLLRNLGFETIAINFEEWGKAKDKEEFLRGKLS